jgi:hypothetical protein
MTFIYRLERENGTPADPLVLQRAVPTWHAWRNDPAWPGPNPACDRDPIADEMSVLVVRPA